MTAEEFGAIAAEQLVRGYGVFDYPPAKLDEIFRCVRDLSAGEFAQILRQHCEGRDRPPNLASIRQAVSPALGRLQAVSRRQKLDTLTARKGACEFCHGTGWLEAQRKDMSAIYKFSFICNCGAAEILGIKEGNMAVRWNQGLIAKGYYIPPPAHKLTQAETNPESDEYIPF